MKLNSDSKQNEKPPVALHLKYIFIIFSDC